MSYARVVRCAHYATLRKNITHLHSNRNILHSNKNITYIHNNKNITHLYKPLLIAEALRRTESSWL